MPRAITTTDDIPAVLGLLPDAAVAKYLTRGMQAGQENPPQVALRKASTSLSEVDARWRTAPVRELLEEAMRRFADNRAAADGWLAPRLHATVRMTRAEAADNRMWNHLAMLVAPDYVVWRHKGAETATTARFNGPHYTQAFARLWWAAELFRDGEDYRPVETACQVQDVLNTTMRLDVVDHRPTTQAILRVLARLVSAGTPRPGDHVNALSSAINAAGSTLVYDVLAPDELADYDALHDWITQSADMPPVPWDRLPDGPHDGAVSQRAVDALLPLFEDLLAQAPVRQRPRKTAVVKA
ncbi:DUF6339 family protein [Streptomyces europaeiscabiei]|uniref:DUF6339 family protein n=1 Tax=Streptomyces europaeiscabiei TaxID=146819 RepID=UPI0029BE62FE|nr:DUF6339 family protein [Streptomyces europaeiscabiei]MDX3585629.1 DUF6339 family protein [Streptomyces europaeiscabiei]